MGRLATLRPDGTLQNSPVGYRYNHALATIDIGGYNLTSSRKYRNASANGQVAFVVDDVVRAENSSELLTWALFRDLVPADK